MPNQWTNNQWTNHGICKINGPINGPWYMPHQCQTNKMDHAITHQMKIKNT